MTSPSTPLPTSDQVTDYYSALGPLLRMAWGDNLHFGYWEGVSDRSSPQEATDRFTDVLTDRLGVEAGCRVLDAGCGIGSPAVRVASLTGAEVWGVTISQQQVDQAVELAERAGLSGRVRFALRDAMDTGYEDGSFDAVLAFESIVHMDRPRALREWKRVLKPGGRIVLTDTFPLDGAARRPGDTVGDVASMATLEEYPRLLADAGLEPVELTDVTEHTKFTFTRVLDGILRCRKDFEREHGMTVEEVLDAMKPAHPQASQSAGFGAPPQVGCLIAVARKPASADAGPR
ncbi:SAM-dependent methyltransferase [Streptomyces sp. NPDC017979]|uniref:SAM-dependent methyltransferase n=1 Tax=Streptomyces sp. NPDC017979 TaxID=3365024 RepID=UPI00378EE9D3